MLKARTSKKKFQTVKSTTCGRLSVELAYLLAWNEPTEIALE